MKGTFFLPRVMWAKLQTHLFKVPVSRMAVGRLPFQIGSSLKSGDSQCVAGALPRILGFLPEGFPPEDTGIIEARSFRAGPRIVGLVLGS